MRGGSPYQEPTSEASPHKKITWDSIAIHTKCFEKCGSSEAFVSAAFIHHVNNPHEKKGPDVSNVACM
ncbi:uncharacterized protein Bfra_009355 [Botrytis fragariae]|uniref:Uncharacterized protein n=1 Tax=Botrytis fragariae TaxID=1964551 RepID=A0A8H6ANU5_9HELO|nr:uncharacterized protein Bfra_009355 [Botrytis fragariae]KAF5870801.1 hypothetical protein Bfra_009355 [Botrytis fragariae]